MLTYVLVCISLALVGLSIFELLYLFYLERFERERRAKIIELEQRCKFLAERLRQAEMKLQEQASLIRTFNIKQSEQELRDAELQAEIIDEETDDEEWAEFIEDR